MLGLEKKVKIGTTDEFEINASQNQTNVKPLVLMDSHIEMENGN